MSESMNLSAGTGMFCYDFNRKFWLSQWRTAQKDTPGESYGSTLPNIDESLVLGIRWTWTELPGCLVQAEHISSLQQKPSCWRITLYRSPVANSVLWLAAAQKYWVRFSALSSVPPLVEINFHFPQKGKCKRLISVQILPALLPKV